MNDRRLARMMRDPRYWRDQEPAIVERVRAEYRRRYVSGTPGPSTDHFLDRMPEWQFYAVLAVVSGLAFLVGILMG